jgi:signal transduction histidine kinase
MKIRDYLQKHKNFFQFSYAVSLMAIIPLLIIFNTVFIVNRYSESLDTALQQRALSVARTVASLVKEDLSWEFFIQHRLDELSQGNVGLKTISVLKPEEKGGYKIVASSIPEAVGKISYEEFYFKAWEGPVHTGLATDSITFNDTYSVINFNNNNKRSWLVAMPINDSSSEKQALLVLELSASVIDQMALDNKKSSIVVVTLTVLFVILFLSVIFRLWDYAVLYKKAKEIDKIKNEFVSMASHELRAPITAISGFTQMLYNGEMGAVNEKVKDSLKMMLNASERLSGLVDDLLDVGRIEQGRIVCQPTLMSPDKIIREEVELYSFQAEEKGLKISYHPHAEKLPELMIDKDRFKQIMANLISNAIKYSREGDVQVITRVRYNKQILEICVKDTGIGLSEEERSHLFEKFYRARNDKAGKVTGTGLGLWITKQLVELMGGKILVESIEDVGSQFVLRFPVAK